GISSARPLVRRLVISRRNTPDLVNGSRNLTLLSAQRSAPLLLSAQASATVSSIRLANSGGVNTSSLERLAMQVKTSGLRPRSEKLALSLIWPSPSHRPKRRQAHVQSLADMPLSE